MGRLFEGFEILCTDYDHMLEKSENIIQGRTLFKEIRYITLSIAQVYTTFKNHAIQIWPIMDYSWYST